MLLRLRERFVVAAAAHLRRIGVDVNHLHPEVHESHCRLGVPCHHSLDLLHSNRRGDMFGRIRVEDRDIVLLLFELRTGPGIHERLSDMLHPELLEYLHRRHHHRNHLRYAVRL